MASGICTQQSSSRNGGALLWRRHPSQERQGRWRPAQTEPLGRQQAFSTPGLNSELSWGVPQRCPEGPCSLHLPTCIKTEPVLAARSQLPLRGTGESPSCLCQETRVKEQHPGPAGRVSAVGRLQDRFQLGQTASPAQGQPTPATRWGTD